MYFLRSGIRGAELIQERRVLKPRLWSSLPDDLVEHVLSKLPLQSRVRCRTVCKRWNELILIPNFAHPLVDDSPKCVPFHFTMFEPGRFELDESYFIVYNSKINKWVERSLSFMKLDRSIGLLQMAASAGGLLCFANVTCARFVICNPVSKRWRELQLPCTIGDEPYMSLPPNDFIGLLRTPMEHLRVGLIVFKETGSYKLIVAELYEASQRTTLVYDSETSAWTKGAKAPMLQDSWFSHKPGISCNRALYWIADDYFSSRLFKYDVGKDIWSTFVLPSHGWDLQILEHRSHVVLLTDDGQAEEGVTSFKMYTLHETNDNKMRLKKKKMPKPLTVRLGEVSSSGVGGGNQICFIREFETPDKYINRLEFLVHDFSTKTSVAMPSLPDGNLFNCWAMEPSLTAIA